MDRRQDPRTIVTPYAFSVHPDLLGMPLATPWQRLGAIAVDGVVIIGLSRIGGTTLAVASGLLLFWLAVRKPAKDVFGRLFRVTVGCLGVLVLTVTLLVWGGMRFAQDPERVDRLLSQFSELADSAGVGLDIGVEGASDSLGLGELARVFPDVVELRRAESPEEAREIAADMARIGRDGGMSLQEIRGTLAELMPKDASWSDGAQDIIDEVMGELRLGLAERAPGAESQSEPAMEEVVVISDSVALDSIAALNELVTTLDEERRDVEDQLARSRAQVQEAESGGILAWLLNFIDDLGLGFGWGALYLTITHAWWKGTSVGKKLFRTRVVMIDNRPLNWWLSFERAGGYAAGFATGLLGFAQIFWDPNRQAIHDKVSETIVIQDGKSPVPGPWITEGRAQWEKSRPPGAGPPDARGVHKSRGPGHLS
jgi:hypothetical protein